MASPDDLSIKVEMDLKQTFSRVGVFLRGHISGDALRAKAFRGGAWLGIGSVGEQLLRFTRNLVLARVLVPGAFGTMAIVISSASIVDMLTDVGARAAVIQSPRGGQASYLDASWWLGFIRAVLCYAAIFLLAPWIARFYGRPEIAGLLRIALLSVPFNAAISPRSALAQREMKLGRWAWITNGGGICGVILTVVLSLYMKSVWALAIGYCSENAFRFLLSYVVCPGLPSIKFEWSAAKEILSYSRGVFGLGILNLVVARADIFVLGRLYPLTALGLYTMAVSLVTTPSVFLTNVLGQTLMPALSSIQEDKERLNRVLLEVNSWLVLLGMPAAVSIWLAAPSVLRLAYGARYVSATGPLAVASAVVFFTVLNAMLTVVLFARGLPALHRHAVIVSAVAMLVSVYPACKFTGPIGGQYATLFATLVGYLYQVVLLRSVTGLNLLRYAAGFIPPALGSAAMILIVLGSRVVGLTLRPVADVAVCTAGCLVAYGTCATAVLFTQKRGIGV